VFKIIKKFLKEKIKNPISNWWNNNIKAPIEETLNK
jgi:hypothetical protein